KTHPLRRTYVAAQFGVTVAAIVLHAHAGHHDCGPQAIAGAHADQEETILGNPGIGTLPDLRQPLRLKDSVDDVAEIDSLTHAVGADRISLIFRAGGQEKRGGNGRKPKSTMRMTHVEEP